MSEPENRQNEQQSDSDPCIKMNKSEPGKKERVPRSAVPEPTATLPNPANSSAAVGMVPLPISLQNVLLFSPTFLYFSPEEQTTEG